MPFSNVPVSNFEKAVSPFVCGQKQGFGTTGNAQRRVSGDALDHSLLHKTPPEVVPELAWWPCPPCGGPFLPSLFWAVLPSVPTLALMCRQERLQLWMLPKLDL